ncbi:MAG TPA: protein kinase [Vicinamibacterales bacterium]|nr:protein kinase [Vicinamibacterales bacterium]
MPLTTGARLGAYEILGPLGAGGMGEVYRARDNRLQRVVAIKVLPAAFAGDPERLARFEQEARAAAGLNHPNILAVHDLGQHDGAPFIVTELLEGMSLREALQDGAVPARKAIDCGVAIAQGLAAAHERGIVHRDIKPENVFLTADGRVKILDFGVAKLTQAEPVHAGMTVAPTTPAGGMGTVAGMVLGTIGYMSPEQVRGGIADPRSDIFSLGVVLHELLSGQRPFGGDTAADVMSGILRADPPELPVAARHIPPALARIVGRCLEKSPAARFQSARDLAFALDALTSSSGPEPATSVMDPGGPRRRSISPTAALTGALIAGLLAAAAAWALKPAPSTDAPVTKLSLALPNGAVSANPEGPNLDISADGRNVVFTARIGGGTQLVLRALDRTTGQTLPGTDGAFSPFFSPDGKSIGFFARGLLRTIAIASLEIRDVAVAPSGRGGWWTDSGIIYYAPVNNTGIMKVPSGGGTPSAVTTLDRSKGEISHRWPQVLPGGKAMLLTVWTGPARDNKSIQVLRLDTGLRETVANGGDTGRYVRSGHVLFGRLDALMAVPFDVERLTTTGAAIRTGETVRIGQEGASYAVSDEGTLVHLPGDEHRLDARLVWVGRDGRVEPVSLPAQDIASPIVSPDGRRAAFNLHGATNEIAIADFERGTVTAFTSGTTGSQAPVWSPDGRRIAYRGTRKGFRNVWVKAVDGTSEEQQLTTGDHMQTPQSWSPDGKHLLYFDTDPVTGSDIWIVSVADKSAQPLVKAPLAQSDAAWSPDGRWIAYLSNEYGGPEIFVLPFPLTGQRWRISTSGGSEPAWSPDGRQLFYRNAGQIYAVDVRTSPTFNAGTPQTLFADTFVIAPNSRTGYSISTGNRFLFAQPVRPDPPITQLPVVGNWFSELRRAAGAK